MTYTSLSFGEGRVRLFEDGGEIDKNTKQNKSINYEKIFTFNFCRNAGGVQRAGAGDGGGLHFGTSQRF